MVTYTVKYKLPSSSAWKTITNVVEDGFNEGSFSRYFILANKQRLEIPSTALFQFEARRQDRINEIREEIQSFSIVDTAGLAVPGISHPVLGNSS